MRFAIFFSAIVLSDAIREGLGVTTVTDDWKVIAVAAILFLLWDLLPRD
jgi:hypothetical protein